MCAIKSCSKTENNDDLQKEIDMLNLVQGFQGIVKLIDVYETKFKVNIVMELISGGELFDRIVELEYYSEKDASNLVGQICDAVAFCHTKGVIHRDLKPENLMFISPDSSILKLIDFGVATLDKDGSKIFEIVGTPTYMAPEIEEGIGYGKPVDLYSIGVIMYILLCGYPPLDPEEGIIELNFPSPEWDSISREAIDIIKNLLDENQDNRMTIEQLRNHRWVKGHDVSNETLGSNIMEAMKAYNTIRKTRQFSPFNKGNPPKRMSVFGMFGLTNERIALRRARGSIVLNREVLKQNLTKDFTQTGVNFRAINDNMSKITSLEEDMEKKNVLLQRIEEMKRLQNAFNELKQDFLTLIIEDNNGSKNSISAIFNLNIQNPYGLIEENVIEDEYHH